MRPHLEFAISVWNPFLKRDINILEKVQRRATRMPKLLKGVQYEERLNQLKMTTLKTRRLRGDLIQMYKIKKKIDEIMWHRNPTWSSARHTKRSQMRREIVTACQQRFNFFLNRIANEWNALPDEIVEAESVESFKCKVDAYLLRRPL